jgi:hypothetical protein
MGHGAGLRLTHDPKRSCMMPPWVWSMEYGPFLATHSGQLIRSLIAIRTTRARPQGECTPQPALSLLQLRQVTMHEQSRSAPIDIFQAINAGAELVQQTILNSPALLCDRIRNAMECNHGILGRV